MYYIRVGSQSREASPQELERLFQQRGAFRIEIRPITGSSLSDLDLRRLTQYFAEIRQQATPERHDQEAWNALLVNTEILCQDRGLYPSTVAGQLLFGRTPNRFLPHAGIDAVAYSGVEKEYDTLEREPIRVRSSGFGGSKRWSWLRPGW
jgi:ATP-dependent DNA helicase RecG